MKTKNETMVRNYLNKKLFSDDLMDEAMIQYELYYLQKGCDTEMDSELDKDLLSGHDIIDIERDLFAGEK